MSKKVEKWHRQKGESFDSYNEFLVYVSMGSDRSLTKVAAQMGKALVSVEQRSAKWKWVTRAAAYDDWLISVQEDAIRGQLAADAIKWAKERSDYRKLEVSLAKELIEQGLQMVRAPLFIEQTTETKLIKTLEHPEGELVTVAVNRFPTKWTKRDGVAYLKVASEIMRLSLEMETSRVALSGVNIEDPNIRLEMARASLKNWQTNIDQLVDEQMAANPNQDRTLVTMAIWEKLPEWTARDWKLPGEMAQLLQQEDSEVLPLLPGQVQDGDSVQGPN